MAGSEMEIILETLNDVVIGDYGLEEIYSVTIKKYKRKSGVILLEGCHEYGTITFEFPLEGDLVDMSDEHIKQTIYNFGTADYDYMTDPDFVEAEDETSTISPQIATCVRLHNPQKQSFVSFDMHGGGPPYRVANCFTRRSVSGRQLGSNTHATDI
jgi:hypothetical protein